MDTKIAIGCAALAALLLTAPGATRAQSTQTAPLTQAPPSTQVPPPPQTQHQLPQFAQEFGSGGYLGVSITGVTADKAKQLKLPDEGGVLVGKVAENTPAAKAGLKAGDVITGYDGMKIEGVAEFRRLVRETPPGRQAQMILWRDGHTEKLSAQIGQAPATDREGNQLYGAGPFSGAEPGPGPNFRFAPGFGPGQGYDARPAFPPQGPEGNYGPRQFGQRFSATPTLGIAVENLSGQLGAYFGAPNGEGVLVTEVREGSPAERAGLKAGDVIVEFDNNSIRNFDELRDQLRQQGSNNASVTLGILRKGAEMSLNVTPQPPQVIRPGGPRRIPL